MASVDFMKLHSAVEVKRMLRHCDSDKRLEDNHSNKNINKDRTHLNRQQFGYEEASRRYDDRIAELDRNPKANRKSNRVTAFGLEIPVPLGFDTLDSQQKTAWYQMALDECVSFAGGAQNLIGWYTHEDEKHDYMHSKTGEQKTSREHLHVFVVPEMDGKLGAYKFSSASRMKKINKAIHQRSVKEFGLKFMDGSKGKSNEEVEDLKRMSDLQEQLQVLSKVRDDLQEDIDRMQQEQVNFYLERFRDKVKDFPAIRLSPEERLERVRQIPRRLKSVAERGHEQFFDEIQQNHGNMEIQMEN